MQLRQSVINAIEHGLDRIIRLQIKCPYSIVLKINAIAKQRKMTRDQLVIDILKRELDRQ